MRKSLAELHLLHPYDKEERYWSGPVSLDDSIGFAGNLHEQDDPIAYLDEIREQDYGKATSINRALLFLPPEVVIDELGVDVALWTAITAFISGENKELYDILSAKYGYNVEDMDTANNWEWNKGRANRNVKRILAQYSLMQALRGGVTSEVDLPAVLQNSAQPGIELSDKRIGDYELIPAEADYNSVYQGGRIKGWDEDPERNIGYSSWLDTPLGFALTYKGTPNALVGLSIGSQNELLINQLQGVRLDRIDPTVSKYSEERVIGKIGSRGLKPLDWQRTMVESTEQIAQALDIPTVGIQSGKNNIWVTRVLPREEKPHLTLEQAEQAYDVPAKRLGYTKSDDQAGNWHKSVA